MKGKEEKIKLETSSKNECIKDLYKSITECKMGYQLKTW
jgi:hypothetical protein